QNSSDQKQFSHVTDEFRSYPELGKTTHSVALHQVDYELIQNRTKYSRTFLNTNTTKTTVQSSIPLHYQNNGFWHSIDYSLQKTNNNVIYPVQDPFFEIAGTDYVINIGNSQINIKDQSNFLFVSADNKVTKKVGNA